jgi:hypothetical protein
MTRAEALQDLAAWLRGSDHEEFCPAENKKACDCGLAVARESLRFLAREERTR